MSPTLSSNPLNDYKKQARAQHNQLERRRRDNIKDVNLILYDWVRVKRRAPTWPVHV